MSRIHNDRAEAAVIGLLLAGHPDDFFFAAKKRRLRAESFFLPAHREIFEALVEGWRNLTREGNPGPKAWERVTKGIESTLHANGFAQRYLDGDLRRLAEYRLRPDEEPHVRSLLRHYSREILEAEKLRAIHTEAHRWAMTAESDPSITAADLRERIKALPAVLDSMDGGQFETINLTQAMDDALSQIQADREQGAIPGAETGLRELDSLSGGVRPGELWTLSGSTGGGKSVLLNQIGGGIARNGGRGLWINLELLSTEVTKRLWSCFGRVSMRSLFMPSEMTKGDQENLGNIIREMKGWKLELADPETATMDAIEASIDQFADAGPVDVVVVDYLQLIDGQRKRNEREDQEISRNQRALKNLAKRHRCAVLTASQLNDDGKLYGSRAIGHHSDVVLRIEKEGIRVNKLRNGQVGDLLPLELDGLYQRFIPKQGRENPWND